MRELPWVLDSMERLVREQPLTVNKIFHFNPNGTVYSRAEALIEVNGMVGFSFQATKDAWYGQYASGRMLLLTYESLTSDPKAAMQAVYKFIDEPWSSSSPMIRSGWIPRTTSARCRWCRGVDPRLARGEA